MHEFYRMGIKDTYEALGSNENGLDVDEARKNLQKFGPNKLRERKITPWWLLFLSQFRGVLILILLIAAAILWFVLDDVLEAIVVLVIVILNALLGYVQERKAEQTLEALKKMSAPNALVLRYGEVKKIPASELVPGDVILLSVGNKIPADCRLIEEMNLRVDESVLTGESLPVSKNLNVLHRQLALSERKNMLFSGTTVVYGHCKVIVTATGMNTEFGKIASALGGKEEETPLQRKLAVLGKQLGIIIVLICALVFALGVSAGGELDKMFLTAVALAVAAIPEGLPAVVTITLVLGLQGMVKRNAIIRRLPAVETLGCADVICSDKTGTLTMNEMTVRKIYVNKSVIELSGEGYSTNGTFIKDNSNFEPDTETELLLRIGMMCNDASVDDGVIGDPTEIALLVSSKKAGIGDERKKYNRIAELPFDSERKMMSVVYESNGKSVMYSKGAVEEIIKKCSSIYENGRVRTMTVHDRERIMDVNHKFASGALRVLAFAFRKIKENTNLGEKNLVFIGLQGMIDPPRPEAISAIEQCKGAGIKVIMITGDHKDTAVAVAKELKILDSKDMIVTGNELDAMTKEEFESRVEKIHVYARVSPEHKVKLTEALRKNGHVIAMTGDGVNDAPALKKADIGVAMGITGTDASKEASDMILTDDNFSSIVSAVEEGRRIYDNIRKFVRYTLPCNIGEVMVITVGIVLGLLYPPLLLPLLPLQILWVNLLTDGLPGIAMAVEPQEPDIMKKQPRKPREKIMTKNTILFMLFIATMMFIGTLYLFYTELDSGVDRARTIAFSTLVISQLFVALSVRSYQSIAKVGFFSNTKMILAVLSSMLLQLVVVYIPVMNIAFGTVPLGMIDWVKIFAVAVGIFIILEAKKLISR